MNHRARFWSAEPQDPLWGVTSPVTSVTSWFRQTPRTLPSKCFSFIIRRALMGGLANPKFYERNIQWHEVVPHSLHAEATGSDEQTVTEHNNVHLCWSQTRWKGVAAYVVKRSYNSVNLRRSYYPFCLAAFTLWYGLLVKTKGCRQFWLEDLTLHSCSRSQEWTAY
jgi:hypothetical protein